MRTPLKQLAAICLIAATSLAQAVPLDHDEAVSGDLPFGDMAALVFDVGLNSITGTMSFYSLADADGVQQLHVERDPFEIDLAPGHIITKGTIDIAFTPLNENTLASSRQT